MTGRVACLFLLLLAPAFAQSGRPRLTASLSRSRIHVGERVTYIVTLHNAHTTATPSLDQHTADFDVAQGSTSSQTREINGRVSRLQEFRYYLRPKRKGVLTVPAATLQVQDELLRTETLKLEVVAPEEQDVAILDLRADPPSVYPWQDFTVRLKIFVRRLPGKYRAYDPVEQIRAPALTVPWAEAPEGLEAQPMEEWLNPLLAKESRGFSINNLKLDQPLGFFTDTVLAVFDLDGQPADDVPARLEGRAGDYFVYTLERVFKPRRHGRYDLGHVVLRGAFVDRVAQGRATFRDIYAVSAPLRVVVKPLPAAGKPASFTGGIGAFRVVADAAPRQVRVGDPVTLTLTVTGRGNLEEIGPPAFQAEGFRAYEATSSTADGKRVFTYSLRPASAAVTAIPPVRLSYFDVEQERYVTVATEPVPLTVEESSRLDAAEIEGAPREAGLEALREGLFANIGDIREVKDEAVRPLAHGLYLCGLLLLYGVAVVFLRRRERLRADPALLRRRGAHARARERLERDGLHDTLGGLVADLLDIPEAGLTAKEIGARLRELGVAGADRIEQVLERQEGARYGGVAGGEADARAMLEDMLRELK